MGDESWPEKDLWGEPGRAPRDPRGRKRHRYLPQVAKSVAVLAAAKLTQEQIAAAVGMSVPTLTKYYFRALEEGEALIRGATLTRLMQQVDKGNVTAIGRMLRELEKGDLKPPPRRTKAPAAEPIGKKAQANADAETAHEGTEWGNLLN